MGRDTLNSCIILGNETKEIESFDLIIFFAWLKFVSTEVTELCFVCVSYKFNLLSFTLQAGQIKPFVLVRTQETEQSNVVLFYYSKNATNVVGMRTYWDNMRCI